MYGRRKLGQILIDLGYLDDAQLDAALQEQQRSGGLLGEVLLRLGYITPDQLAQARAEQYDVDYEKVTPDTVQDEAINKVPCAIARSLQVLPLRIEDNRLVVAMANPLDVDAIDVLQRQTGMYIKVVYTNPEDLSKVIDFHYSTAATGSESLDEVISEVGSLPDGTDENLDDLRRAVEDAPVVRIVNLLLVEAINGRASDIHLEPRRMHMEVRYRIDGELQHVRNIPRNLMAACISRIKVMADMDIAERRVPQDGRISIKVEGRQIDLRVSTLPIQYGERVVMRVLDRERSIRRLDELGFSQHNLITFRWLLQRPNGIILVTGPTGSGKTTTLYAALRDIQSVTRNIITCEDPIEYELEGINQSNVNEKAGLTFAAQLRAILRQDPDVVLVGEIRDQETAEIACRAAMTGHLVLSTLHTNDAVSAIPRLIDMGVEPFLISSSLVGVVAQRLVRVICPHCKQGYEPTLAEVQVIGRPVQQLYRGAGCSACGGRGYLGRISVHEILVVDDEIRALTIQHAPSSQMLEAALRKGMIPMSQDGIEKAIQGITTLDEVTAKAFISSGNTTIDVMEAA
ncbi:MAG: ATPase, T2SS/T4P/T4SS family [Armatimonadota bacterium]|nr:ATPase, T2SS/T4P/T4SS family [bacterium]MDW8320215.1 ATPase, T2SS/T4P/T4SS family [Armatimonadota bacterium]